MIAEGRLSLEIGWNGKRVTGTAIRSTRPLQASRLLEGKPVAQAIETVPLLFSVCGRAQTVAAAAACAAALGKSAGPAAARLRERMVAAECLQEYLWRLLLDLPPLLGEAPQLDEFVLLRRGFAEVTGKLAAMPHWWMEEAADDDADWSGMAEDAEAFLARVVFGMPCADWLGLQDEAFAAWLEGGATPTARLQMRLSQMELGRSTVTLLPPADEMLRALAPLLESAEDFAGRPLWQGAPAETGALARQAMHPRLRGLGSTVGARVLARLVELARLPARLRAGEQSAEPWVRATALRPGVGFSAVETARGTLVHGVTLADDKGNAGVARWRIVAPTEWNFHPQGAFAQGLAGAAARSEDEVRRAAALLAHALDPCVAYEIRVQHA
jgi:coenzyme F420-reducing hydrogenase alpha subunit